MIGIHITDEIISVLNSLKLEMDYVTVATNGNVILFALEGVNGIVSVLDIEETEHPKFVIRVNLNSFKQVMKTGYITFVNDNKFVEITNYSNRDCTNKKYSTKLARGYSEDIKYLLSILDTNKLIDVNYPKYLLNKTVQDLIWKTQSPIYSASDYYYSRSEELSFFIKRQPDFENVVIDTKLFDFLIKNINDTAKVYKDKNTLVLNSGALFYNWREEYAEDVDINYFMNKKPIASYEIELSSETPFLNSKILSSKKINESVKLDFETNNFIIDTKEMYTESLFNFVKIDGIDLESITIPLRFCKYLSTMCGRKKVNIFKSFIRVLFEGIIIDIGCDVKYVQRDIC